MTTTFQVDKMPVTVYESNAALGEAAAYDFAQLMRQTVDQNGEASVILATGNSQLSFITALKAIPDIPWGQITVFHMDEYLGLPEMHPASFRRYIREKVDQVFTPKAVHYIMGDAPDTNKELQRYEDLLAQNPPVLCVCGIGENGHLAFNDPPADFNTDETIHIVILDEVCRKQQVGEGHFATMDDVPPQAITLTVPALIKPPHVMALVPEARKAQAVKTSLEGPVTEDCPASILRTYAHVHLYLDTDSASLLTATTQ